MGVGNLAVGPFSDEWTGRLKRVEMRDWVEVSVNAMMWASRSAL